MLGVTCLIMRLLLVVTGLHAAYANGPCPVDPQVSCTSCSLDDNNEWILNCGNVQLVQLPNITFGYTDQVPVIRKMLFNSNRIETVPLYKLSGLVIKELYMQGNDLQSTDFLETQSLETLETLDLSENSNLVTNRSHFSFLTNLKTLKMVYSNLYSLDFLRNPQDPGSHLANLQNLFLSYNSLGGENAIHPDTFHQKTKLARFEATGCTITSIGFLRVNSLSNLRILALQRNDISAIGQGDTLYLSSLGEFDIGYNNLTTLSVQAIDNLPAIQDFYWVGNPVECSADISWLPEWQSNNPDVNMANPEQLTSCLSTAAYSASSIASTYFTMPKLSTMWLPVNPTQQMTRQPSQKPTTYPPPGSLPVSFPQEAILALAVAVPIVLAVVILVSVVLIWRKQKSREETSGNAKFGTEPKPKDDETYHYYSFPIETGPAMATNTSGRVPVNMEDRPLPIPEEIRASLEDGHGYLIPETTKNVDEYLEPVISTSKSQSQEPRQLRPDTDYMDFDPSTGDHLYETFPNRDENNDTYEDLTPHQKSIRGHDNSTYF